LEPQSVIISQILTEQLEITAEQNDMPPGMRAKVGFDDDDHIEQHSEILVQKLSTLEEHNNCRWLVSDYETSGMVILTGYMIHAATQNNSAENRIRLSSDIRYQRIHVQIDQSW